MVCRLAVNLHHLLGSCDFDKEENAAEATNSSGWNTIQLPSPTLFLRYFVKLADEHMDFHLV